MGNSMLVLQERWVLFIVQALLAGPLAFNKIGRRATGPSHSRVGRAALVAADVPRSPT